MVAIRIFEHRGIRVGVWAKSFKIGNGSCFYIHRKPDEKEIKQLIDAAQVDRFPGDEHRQLYYSWRHYPKAMKITLALGFILGQTFGFILYLIWR